MTERATLVRAGDRCSAGAANGVRPFMRLALLDGSMAGEGRSLCAGAAVRPPAVLSAPTRRCLGLARAVRGAGVLVALRWRRIPERVTGAVLESERGQAQGVLEPSGGCASGPMACGQSDFTIHRPGTRITPQQASPVAAPNRGEKLSSAPALRICWSRCQRRWRSRPASSWLRSPPGVPRGPAAGRQPASSGGQPAESGDQ